MSIKRHIITLVLFAINYSIVLGQKNIEGEVFGILENGTEIKLIGANIYWENVNIGTTSDENGKFKLEYLDGKNLIVSFVGFKTETLKVSSNEFIIIKLIEIPKNIQEVVAQAKRPGESINYLSAEKITHISHKELIKAACCNLSESFERNPSIDVAYADAITGIKQIEALGMSGIYTAIALENIPFIRGLYSINGLSSLPGPWINSIYYSKGAMSVVNSHESITGGINIELKEIFDLYETFHYNIYFDNEKRFESNAIFRNIFNDNLATAFYANFSSRKSKIDHNSDGFYDMPEFENISLMNRWQFYSDNLEGNIHVFYNKENKTGGILKRSSPNAFIFKSNSNLLSLATKIGYNFSEEHANSIGTQFQITSYDNSIIIGKRLIDANQLSFYGNLIYQTEIVDEIYEIKTGVNANIDKFEEEFLNLYKNDFLLYGLFLENVINFGNINLILGFRNDIVSNYGLIFSPRLNLKYHINEDLIFRVGGGKGFRKYNLSSDNMQLYASNKRIIFNNFTYENLNDIIEIGWNYGGSLTYHFAINDEEAYISFDYYRTIFSKSVVVDLLSNSQDIYFSSLANGSYSNSFLIEFGGFILSDLEIKAAYKYLDSKIKVNNKFEQKPFISKNRILFNLSYNFGLFDSQKKNFQVNLNANWFDKKRLPNTKNNPPEFVLPEFSKSFYTVNSQLNYFASDKFLVYLGVENLLDFRQNKLILDYQNPDSNFFDASIIWGPTQARMGYFGIRHSL